MKTTVVNLNKDDYDVYIGRGSKWGNPYVIGKDGNRKDVIDKYKKYLKNNQLLLSSLKELDGKRLGCYCKPKSCHGDILVEMLNKSKKEQSLNSLFGD